MNQAGAPPTPLIDARPGEARERPAGTPAPARRGWWSLGRPGRDGLAWLVALAAFLAYAPAFWWGLPFATSAQTVHGWDVDGIAGIGVLSEVHNLLRPTPDWYTAYPVLHYLLLATVYGPYMVWLKLSGGLHAVAASYPYGLTDPVTTLRVLALLGRLVTLGMAVGTVAAIYVIGRELWGRMAGVLGALFVMLMAPMLYYARTSNLDVPVLFWSALAALAAVRALRQGLTIRRALALGALAALALATKDQAYGAWVAGVGYVALVRLREREVPRAARWRSVLALCGSATAVYVVASGIPFFPGRFISHVHFLLEFKGEFFNLLHANTLTVLRPATALGGLQLLGDLVAACAAALGPVLLAAGILGLAVGLRRAPASRVLAWAVVGFFALVLVPVHHMQYRYALLPAAVLALFGAYLLAAGLKRGGAARALAAVVLVLGLGWEVVAASDLTYQMLFDARYAAGDWLASHARGGDRVGYFGAEHQLPHIPPGVTPVQLSPEMAPAANAAASPPEAALRSGAVRWVLVVPDYSSDAARDRSLFLPAATYAALRDGSLGYRRVARFATPSLIGRPLPYLPYVNPRVQVFERVSAR